MAVEVDSEDRDQTRTLEPTAPHRTAQRMALAGACLGFFVITLDTNIVVVALPVMGDQLHAGISGLQWVSAGYTMIFSALLLSAGTLSDRYGASRVYLWGLALFGTASAACGLAPGIGVLVGARIVAGAAAALLMPATLALVREIYPDATERASAIAIWTATGGAAVAAGPLAGGVLTTALGWRSIFFVNVPIVVAGLVVAARAHRSTPRQAPFDWTGQVTVVTAIAALALAVIEGGSIGFGTPLVVGAFAVVVVAGAAFVVAESRTRHPMVPPTLFRSRPVTCCTLAGITLNVAFYGVVFILSLFFQQVRGESALTAGLMFLPTTALVTLVNLLAGRLTKRFGARPPLLAGQLILAAGLLILLVVTTHTSTLLLLVLVVPLGVGGGLAVPPLTTAMLDAVDADHGGLASGVLNAGRQVGSTLGVAIFGVLLAGAAGFTTGMHLALILGALLLLATTILTRWLLPAEAEAGPGDSARA